MTLEEMKHCENETLIGETLKVVPDEKTCMEKTVDSFQLDKIKTPSVLNVIPPSTQLQDRLAMSIQWIKKIQK